MKTVALILLATIAAARADTTDVSSPTDVLKLRVFEEPLYPIGLTFADENAQLRGAIASLLAKRANLSPSEYAYVDLSEFEAFLAGHPDSAWKPTLLANLGIAYYARGQFSKALAAWEESWRIGREVEEKIPRLIVDRALAELSRMYARLGMMEQIEALVAEARDRVLTGASKEMFLNAREGL